VTVCIGALCEYGNRIVAVSDHKVSFGDFTADRLALKTEPIHRNWHVLFAGNDITHVRPILAHLRVLLNAKKSLRGKPQNDGNVGLAMEIAYQYRLERIIEARVLKRFGYSASEFKKNGKRLLTPEQYHQICSRIERINLECEFLACGFDALGIGHLVVLDQEGSTGSYDQVGFWAIGSGAHAALSSLAFYAQNYQVNHMSGAAEVLFSCLASKFISEANPLVGEDTYAAVYSPELPEGAYVDPTTLKRIKSTWKKYGAPRVPRAAIAELSRLISGHKELY
jgi:hypothetical protein